MKGNNRLVNDYEKYAVVDSKGKIIETFRQKITAMNEMVKLKRDYFTDDLKIIVVPRKK